MGTGGTGTVHIIRESGRPKALFLHHSNKRYKRDGEEQ